MSNNGISRRNLLAMAGAAAVVSASPARRAFAANKQVRKALPHESPELLAPLRVGEPVGTWRISSVSPVRAGAMTVDFTDKSGRCFSVDICKRDTKSDAPAPPAHTDLFDLFVANRGLGDTPTAQQLALAAIELANVVRKNEHHAANEDWLTLRERLDQHPELQRI